MTNNVVIKQSLVDSVSAKGPKGLLDVLIDAIKAVVGGNLTAQNMPLLNVYQITLLAYDILRDEVMDGGFIQLIHNGYGGFIFLNPFAKIIKAWGLPGLAKEINKGRKLYLCFREQIERDCDDNEFMAMYEQYPQFDDLDDTFVEAEEGWTLAVATYVDGHIEQFAVVEK